ncbi:hypothetical protein BTHI11S_04432 [Bosea thiooxidans]|uniref:DUF930 domain-containing protein n=1 Tax=Bosea thiooxidans TaxID=53254 RepID=A0A1T5BHI7_9HYPH|nr:DUF930 domain-containing protein [Bosea thiooxidans]SKB46754.1 protein of unknown function [Bosea thiooxidans]
MAVARRMRWALPDPGLPAAGIIHAALLAWLASVAVQRFDQPPAFVEQSVDVELQTPEQFEAMTRPPPPPPAPAVAPEPAPPPSVPPVPAPAAPPVSAETSGLVRPRRLLSQQVLADPRSLDTRAMLPRLAPEERVEQLCGLEAMGQIHAWQARYEPDRVSAYATADTRYADRILRAEGAAFRSRRRWYGLRFECTISTDLKRVTAFAFRVGEPIPQARWQALGLPALH